MAKMHLKVFWALMNALESLLLQISVCTTWLIVSFYLLSVYWFITFTQIIIIIIMIVIHVLIINFVYVSGYLAYKLIGDTTNTSTEIKYLRL